MTAADAQSGAVVIASSGAEMTFGGFLATWQRAQKTPVVEVARAAQISRANFYLLKNDRQRPSLQTAAALLAALGAQCRIPSESENPTDLLFDLGGASYQLRINWSQSERVKARARFLSSPKVGLAAAVGLAGGAAVLPIVGGAVGSAAVISAGSAAATALSALAELKRVRRSERDRQSTGDSTAGARTKRAAMHELLAAAEQLEVDEIDALTALVKTLEREASREGARAR